MNIQQVLQKADLDYINRKLTNLYGKHIGQKQLEEYKQLLNITPVYNQSKILICVDKIDEKAFEYDYSIVENIGVYLYDKIDIITKKFPTYEETLVADINQDYIYSQPISFEPWKNLLGYDISEVSISAYGIDVCAYAIFFEMSVASITSNQIKDLVQIKSEQYATINTKDILNNLESGYYEDYLSDIEEKTTNVASDNYLNNLAILLKEDIQMKNLAILNELLSMEKKQIKSSSIRLLVRL